MAICKLCLKENELRNSHIIPEFFYKPLYDGKHRFNVLALDEDQKRRYEQKGIREKLLCDKCEGQISKYEDHVRRVFYGGTGIYITNGNPLKLEGIDYNLFKLFQLSILWRAAVSNHDFFGNISLGPHEKVIHKMIQDEKPGTYLDYPCLTFMILMGKTDVMDAFIYPPQMIRFDNQRTFRFIFGGCFWIYFVSSHTNRIRIKEFILNEDGKILIPLKKAENTDFFQALSRNVVKHNKI